MGATSTITGAYIVQQLSIAVAAAFMADGVKPPVFLSSNVDAGDAWNRDLFRNYYHV